MSKHIFENIARSVLNEDQQSKSMDQARKLYMDKNGCSYEQADAFIRDNLRSMFPPLRYKKPAKFILAATRLYLENSFTENRKYSIFNSILKIASTDEYINKFDRNMNGLSLAQLEEQFNEILNDELSIDKAEIGNLELNTNNDYQIVKIDSYKQASQYGKYTSWCVTHDKSMYDNYTDENESVFYFCLKKGFENIKKVNNSDDNPLDEYGLSMLAICVDFKGRLKTCTCRWNHDCGGHDNIMNTREISELLGVNFYNVFKPRTPEELRKMGIIPFSDIEGLLKSGEDVSKYGIELYEEENDYGLRYICYRSKSNYVTKNNEILSKNIWFDDAYDDFAEERPYTRVSYNGGTNLLDYKGNLMLRDWVNEISLVDESGTYNNNLVVIRVRKNEGRTYSNIFNLSTNTYISENWFFGLSPHLSDGFALVENEKYKNNFIDLNGNLLLKEWVKVSRTFENGFAIIENERKYNYINTNGEIISDKWFDDVNRFKKEGYAIVGERKIDIGITVYNYLTKEGNLLCKEWFLECKDFKHGFAIGKKAPHENYLINSNGDIVNKEPFYDIVYSDNVGGFFVYKYENGKERLNLILKNGKLLSDLWVDNIEPPIKGFMVVRLDGLYNLMRTDGTLLSNQWFDRIYNSFKNGYTQVVKGDKSNFIDKEGNILCNRWFDDVSNFSNGFAIVRLHYDDNDDKLYYNFINTEGKLITHEKLNLADYFREGFALVVDSQYKANFLGTDGKFLIKTDKYVPCDGFSEGFAPVKTETNNGDKYNFIDRSGNLIGNVWYDGVNSFYNGFARVKNGITYNFINTSGKLIRHQWYSYASYFEEGFAVVGNSSRKYNYIDTNGNLLCNEWFNEAHNFTNGYGQVRSERRGTLFVDKNGKLHKNPKISFIDYDDDHDEINECIKLIRRIERL